MPAPLVAAAAAPAVGQALAPVVKGLTTPLVTIEGKVYRRVRERRPRVNAAGQLLLTKTGRVRTQTVERLEPIDLRVGVSPLGILALGLASIGTWIVWNGINIGTPLGQVQVFPGLKYDEETRKALRIPIPGTGDDGRGDGTDGGTGGTGEVCRPPSLFLFFTKFAEWERQQLAYSECLKRTGRI